MSQLEVRVRNRSRAALAGPETVLSRDATAPSMKCRHRVWAEDVLGRFPNGTRLFGIWTLHVSAGGFDPDRGAQLLSAAWLESALPDIELSDPRIIELFKSYPCGDTPPTAAYLYGAVSDHGSLPAVWFVSQPAAVLRAPAQTMAIASTTVNPHEVLAAFDADRRGLEIVVDPARLTASVTYEPVLCPGPFQKRHPFAVAQQVRNATALATPSHSEGTNV